MTWRSVTGFAGRVLAWTVLLSATALVVVGVLVPRLVGGTPYAVLTGSMAPALPPGTLAVTRPVDIDEVRVGEVVTYQLRSGEPTVVTHRVVGTRVVGGERLLLTRGDTNSVIDAEPVQQVQLRGRVWYAVPWLGRASGLLSGEQRQALVWVTGGLLAGYSAWMFSQAALDRRRGGRRPAGRRVAGPDPLST